MSRLTRILVLLLLVRLANLEGQTIPAPSPVASTAPGVAPASNVIRWGHEDWNALPLAKSGLNTSSYVAVVLGTYQEPTYTRELVRLQWRIADPVDLYVILPRGVRNPPAILYLYDYRFDTERFRDEGWCTRSTMDGAAAIGFTPALSIERFHNRPMKEWFVSELQESLGSSTHDVQMIINYLATRGDIDVNRIGMFGEGSGGAIAVLAAAVDPRIKALDLLNPWGDWPDWLSKSLQIPENERAAYLTPESLARVENLDPVKFIPRLSQKVRIQQVLDDPVTPREAKDKIAAAVHAPQRLARYQNTVEHVASWQKTSISEWLVAELPARQAKSP